MMNNLQYFEENYPKIINLINNYKNKNNNIKSKEYYYDYNYNYCNEKKLEFLKKYILIKRIYKK